MLVTITIEIPAVLLRKVRAAAKRRGISVNDYFVRAVEWQLERDARR